MGVAPAGVVLPYAGAAAPAGWLLCHGQAISRTYYPELFTAIGVAFGAGDGSTTFNAPDLRGRVAGGRDDMGGTAAGRLTAAGGVAGATLGAAGGNESHTLTGAQSGTAAHGHTATPSLTTDAQGAHSHSVTGSIAVAAATAADAAQAHPNT